MFTDCKEIPLNISKNVLRPEIKSNVSFPGGAFPWLDKIFTLLLIFPTMCAFIAQRSLKLRINKWHLILFLG